MTLADLAEALERGAGHVISLGQLSRIETNTLPYSQGVLEAIASVLQTTPGDLLGRNPKVAQDDPLADLSAARMSIALA